MRFELIQDLELMGTVIVPIGSIIKQEEDGEFYLVHDNVQLSYSEDELTENTEYFKKISDKSDEKVIEPGEIKQWRIQLNITTDEETLKVIDKSVREQVKKILDSNE